MNTKTIAVIDDHILIANAISDIIREHSDYIFFGGFSGSYEFEQALDNKDVPFSLSDLMFTEPFR